MIFESKVERVLSALLQLWSLNAPTLLTDMCSSISKFNDNDFKLIKTIKIQMRNTWADWSNGTRVNSANVSWKILLYIQSL